MELIDNTSHYTRQWYEMFHGHFMRIGLKYGYKRDELEDLIHQFFLDLLEKNPNPSSINNPQAYLSVAFKRKLIDHHRQLSNKNFVGTEEVEHQSSDAPLQEQIEQIQLSEELQRQIRKAYEKLPERCQKVIYLKFYKELSTEEIAKQTGLTKRTVYNNLFEGVKLLRTELHKTSSPLHFAAVLSFLPLLLAGEF